MWRAVFLAVGISLCILGAECLAVERFVMAGQQSDPTPQNPTTLFGSSPSVAIAPKRDVETAEWAPWSFLSAGAVIILYSLTISKSGP